MPFLLKLRNANLAECKYKIFWFFLKIVIVIVLIVFKNIFSAKKSKTVTRIVMHTIQY